MARHAARLCILLSALGFGAGCGTDTIARTTIDVRCGSSSDCPTGFECRAEVEHGPPTTLCESQDPAVTCPAGYDTKLLYGQTLCKPFGGTAAREHRGAMSSADTATRAGRTGLRSHAAR